MKTDIFIPARLGSKRLHKKHLKKINNKPVIKYLCDRLKLCQKIDDIVICTTKLEEDNELEEFAKYENISIFRGSEHDILNRFLEAGKQFETKKFIFQARIVIFTESSASIDAIMNYIPLISKDSQFYDENQKYHNSHYVEHLDIPVINLDKRFDYTLLSKIKNITPNRKKYKDYIKKFVAPDKSSLPGHLKFAQIIYKEFNIYE